MIHAILSCNRRGTGMRHPSFGHIACQKLVRTMAEMLTRIQVQVYATIFSVSTALSTRNYLLTTYTAVDIVILRFGLIREIAELRRRLDMRNHTLARGIASMALCSATATAFRIANISKRVAIYLLFALCRPCTTGLGTPETKQHKRPCTLYTQTMQSLLTNSLIRCSMPSEDMAYNQRERHLRNQRDLLVHILHMTVYKRV